MPTDLFNPTSNNYINPDLAECAGSASDDTTLEFLNGKKIGVVAGSDILASIDLGDISEVITAWSQQTKILEPGEVTFIQGLTKGISDRTQRFLFDGSTVYDGVGHDLYMSANLHINYYRNFKYYDVSIFATSNPALNTTIENALNIAFGAQNISVTATYDASGLTFVGSPAGYSFNITSIDVSAWPTDSSVAFGNPMIEDVSAGIPAFKYPNSAMVGYILKVTYPIDSVVSDRFIKINHVPDYLTYYVWADVSSYYLKDYDAVDAGMSGASTSDTLSAGDYLYYVDTNNLWEKVGPVKIWLSTSDPADSNIENLITGFYVFNPHTYAIKIDYMVVL